HQGADGPPAPGESVHNAHMDERTVRVHKPGDVHPATDPADMGDMHPMLVRLQTLPGGPAHGKAVPMRGHLYQAFGGVAGEDGDPPVMWQQARPVLHSTRHREHVVHVATDRDAMLLMHASLLSCCASPS